MERSMKKTLCLITSLITLGISGCEVFLGPDVPVGMGTLRISFGEDGGGRSAFDVSEDILATLRYDLVLTGPDKQKISASFAVGQTFNGQVALGEWLIKAKAFTPDNALFGTGSTTITVRAGPNQALVPMTRVAAEDTPVSALDLTTLVTAPERDAMPNTAINELQYAGTIAWKNADGTSHSGNFAPSTAYTAVISLTAKTGYTFAGVGADSFSHDGAETVTNVAGSGNVMTVTIVFPATAAPGVTTVSALNLTELVIVPVKHTMPATAINIAQYAGTITWEPADSPFAPATPYQATVSLTAKTGYTFAGLGANSFIYAYTGATVTNPAGSGTVITVTITFPATEADMVNAFDLTTLVTAPERDATPNTAGINEPQYSGTIAWDPADATFAPSTAYQAMISLTATAGYTFAGVGANSFIYAYAGATATNLAGNGNNITVTISFSETAPPGQNTVTDLDLTALVTAPVKHVAPTTTINAPQYTGAITWQPAGSPFAPSTIYQAMISLTAKTGYTFAGVGANTFTYTGATATNPAGSGTTITVTISFPATAAPDPVSDLDLTTLVTAPVKHRTPATAINTAQYAGLITWQPADSPFAPSTIYQAVINLTAKTGYTFAGVGANSFIYAYTGATATNPAGSGNAITVTISFPETAPPDPVNALDLTALVIAPEKGATPGTTAINEPQYTGTITWQPADSPFAPSIIYQAVINLTATAGYTFAGVGADSFTYTGATATNPAGSGNAITVTISFPVTAPPDTVNALDLTALVIAPEKGATPNTATINEPQYTGSITWQPAGSPFAPSTIYQAVINLTATAGYTFAGVGANSFTYTGATATNPAGSGTTLTVTIGFPATADPHTIILNPDAGDEVFSQANFTISGTDIQTVAVVAGLGYTNPRWFVDGDLKGTTDTIPIDAAHYSDSPGVHNLTLVITKSGVSWSKEITFTVN
jgi:hypothetical protein